MNEFMTEQTSRSPNPQAYPLYDPRHEHINRESLPAAPTSPRLMDGSLTDTRLASFCLFPNEVVSIRLLFILIRIATKPYESG